MNNISIVIPVYNGASTVGAVVDRLIGALGPGSLAVILVNDGSTDASGEVCRALQAAAPRIVTYLNLSKNFGEHNAVMAGLHYATGDYTVIMDDDLQNPPEEVPRMIEHARLHDHDVVYTRYALKRHHWLRNLGSRFNDLVASFLLEKPRGLYLSSFKCLNRFAVKEVIRYAGPYPYIDGLILRSTRNIGTIEVRHEPRGGGRSNYTARRLVSLWMKMVVNFSVLPLRVSTAMGFLFSAAGFLLGVWVVAEKMSRPWTPVGWASLVVVVITFSGIQLVMLGLLGEYIGRLFLASNQTPQFVVRDVYHGGEK
jgi:undecaprenyl-phosphate 4-deoxy-4-formamido-L-arabinose transferase